MAPMMMLVVGWTMVGGFVFTMLITCLSLVGWIKFADRKQQQKLFLVLIVELVVGVGAKALDKLTVDVGGTETRIAGAGELKGETKATLDVTRTLLEPGGPPIQSEQLTAIVDRLRPTPGVLTSEEILALKVQVKSLPAGNVKPVDAAAIQKTEIMRRVPTRDMKMLPR